MLHVFWTLLLCLHTNTAAVYIFFLWDELWCMCFGHSFYAYKYSSCPYIFHMRKVMIYVFWTLLICLHTNTAAVHIFPQPASDCSFSAKQSISTSHKSVNPQVQIQTNTNVNTNTAAVHIFPQPTSDHSFSANSW